ncbi:MAG: phage holin family protein [Anaerolineae bacterium]
MNFLIRVVANAVGLWAATRLVPGISVGDGNYIVTLLIVAIIFGLVNAVIKPIIDTLACSLYILTLGLFIFIVNALMLMLTGWLAQQVHLPFYVDGFWAALIGAIVVGVVSFLFSILLPEKSQRPREHRSR